MSNGAGPPIHRAARSSHGWRKKTVERLCRLPSLGTLPHLCMHGLRPRTRGQSQRMGRIKDVDERFVKIMLEINMVMVLLHDVITTGSYHLP